MVCNAHLDPVWQWEWQEGLAETLSTFRIAADFCEKQEGFIFNHNEALLYQWVEQYDPVLFRRIQGLVQQGRWHIMGGWFLQPDCNMPCGEVIWRQILTGRRYFQKKFNCRPTVAASLDAFGHSRGLVQLLKKTGYEGYLVVRPVAERCGAPATDFRWIGYDGSEIIVHMANEGYNSFIGKAAEKVQELCSSHPDADRLLVMWGIGDHGGGPSRIDLQQLEELGRTWKTEGRAQLIHSTPEAYFEQLNPKELPHFERDLNPAMVGCYTSQMDIKQRYSRLESELLRTEKMLTAAQLQTDLIPDMSSLAIVEETLLFHTFHDILPGTSVKRAERASLQAMDGGLTTLARLQMQAFIAMAKRLPKPVPDTIPIFVYNPHPYSVTMPLSCEFQLPDQNLSGTCIDYQVICNGKEIPSQLEKEDSNIPIDWRKRLVFQAKLAPMTMTVLSCKPHTLPDRPHPVQQDGDQILLHGVHTDLQISCTTGWITGFVVDGMPLLKQEAGQLLVLTDNEDPWKMTAFGYPRVANAFRLATWTEASQIAGLPGELKPVRIIEQGAVRTVVEAIFVYKKSHAVIRYQFDRQDTLRLWIRLFWAESDAMVKLSFPTTLENSDCFGQVMFGREQLRNDGSENIAQHWIAVADKQRALRIINVGLYGSDFQDGELRLSLLRSPAYCAHPIENRTILPPDRYSPRIDQGECEFSLTLDAGDRNELLKTADRAAQLENEQPMALPMFTDGNQSAAEGFLELCDAQVLLTSCRPEPKGCVLHLYHADVGMLKTEVKFPRQGIIYPVTFGAYEVKAFRLSDNVLTEISLLEEPLHK